MGLNSNSLVIGDSHAPSCSQSAASAGSAATETVERTFFVALVAHGWNGRFTLPESCFNELTSFLTRRACAEKPPNGGDQRSAQHGN